MSTPPPPPSGTPTATPNYLAWAIVSTVFATIFSMLTCCCLPLGLASGIPAIIFANKANRMASFDDPVAARDAADKARLWCWVTTALAIVFGLLIALWVLANVMGYANSYDMQEVLEEIQRQQR